MPEAALRRPAELRQTAPDPAPTRVTELKVSGHLMTLDAGLFCVVLNGSSMGPSGLPGVRLSQPPGMLGRPDSVTISTFRPDGWLGGGEAAALIRVAEGPAQVLVTIYQSPEATPEQAPRLQVLRLTGEVAPLPAGADRRPKAVAPIEAEMVAHVQRMGDVGAKLGEWMGTRGSRLWIEGFGIAPRGIAPTDIEYQAVLGRDWLSPWVDGGKFCGSRGMALPLLGLNIRLKGGPQGGAAATHRLAYSATFVDGSAVGPVAAGEPCRAESLAALEAFRIDLRPNDTPARETPARAAPSRGEASRSVPPKAAASRGAAPKRTTKRS